MCSVGKGGKKKMDGIEELKKNVDRLRKNRENVPLDVLETKYKAAYENLLAGIQAQATEILNRETMKGIWIRKADEDILNRIQNAMDKEQFAKQAGKALFQHFSVDKFVEIVENARAATMAVWIPYWKGFCCIYAAPECWEEPFPPPKIYNELTDEFLVDEEKNLWQKRPEWKSDQATIITAGACSLLAGALRDKEERQDGQTGEH